MATAAGVIDALLRLPGEATVAVGFREGSELPRLFASAGGKDYEVLVSDGVAHLEEA